MNVGDNQAAVIDLDAYLERIHFDGTPAADLATLRELVRLHTQHMAFENLDSLQGQRVPLDSASLQRKLIQQRRGGYCFEHNMLLWQVLRQIGFRVGGLASRVRWNVPDSVVTPIGHMMLRVSVAGRDYLVDAGFGGITLSAPLALLDSGPQSTPHERFRLDEHGGEHTLLVELREGWRPLYRFTLTEYQPADYEVWNWFTCTAPQSPFTKVLMAARTAADGRHALLNNRYTWRPLGGDPVTRRLVSAAALREVLSGPFMIRMPDDEATGQLLFRLASIE